MIRRIKFVYALYNFFHKKELMHNLRLYKKLGINKRYYSSISSKDFANILPTSSNEQDTKSNIAETALFKSADEQTKQSILGFKENGYIVLKNYLSEDKVDEINSEIEKALNEKRVKFKYRNKIMFAIDKLDVLKQVGLDHKLTSFLSALMKGEAILFQSINFLSGSEQKTHSDSIHMTTYPLGGLLGVWIALEDISADNGPLHYYPGSHKLPYYLNSDYDNEGNKFLIGDKDYTEYEKMIAEKISDKNLKKESELEQK